MSKLCLTCVSTTTHTQHVETIFAAKTRSRPQLRYRREILRCPDGGCVALDWELDEHPDKVRAGAGGREAEWQRSYCDGGLSDEMCVRLAPVWELGMHTEKVGREGEGVDGSTCVSVLQGHVCVRLALG